MTIRYLALASLLAVSGTSCTTTGTPPVVSGVVGGIVDCAEAGIHEAALGLLDNVALAVATGDYISALTDLVKRFGEGAVDCAVREVGSSSRHNAMAANDPLEQTKAQRATAWLASRPVTLK